MYGLPCSLHAVTEDVKNPNTTTKSCRCLNGPNGRPTPAPSPPLTGGGEFLGSPALQVPRMFDARAFLAQHLGCAASELAFRDRRVRLGEGSAAQVYERAGA